MKFKKSLTIDIFLFIVIFTNILTPILADFQVGDSCLPVDEEGFIEYDFEDEFASALSKVEVKFVDVFEFDDIITGIGVNITVSESNSTSNISDILIIDSISYQNLTCLLYNKTHQFFKFGERMNILLEHGYGGYYIIPNNPVDINVVKGYVEVYTPWTVNLTQNSIHIDTGNHKAILSYNEHGILLKEEIRLNNEIISTLNLIEKEDGDNLDLTLLISLTVIIGLVVIIIPIGIIRFKKSR